MDDILAAHVLMSHLPEITDGAYKTATEIAIETLLEEAEQKYWWFKPGRFGVSIYEYLGLTPEQYEYWLKGKR